MGVGAGVCIREGGVNIDETEIEDAMKMGGGGFAGISEPSRSSIRVLLVQLVLE